MGVLAFSAVEVQAPEAYLGPKWVHTWIHGDPREGLPPTALGIIANVAVPLPFTTVPLSLATFAVLLIGIALGQWRGGLTLVMYMAAGMAGMPWFAEQSSGWAFGRLADERGVGVTT